MASVGGIQSHLSSSTGSPQDKKERVGPNPGVGIGNRIVVSASSTTTAKFGYSCR